MATIGLEIHAELKTQTKMFCNSKNDPDEGRPNTNICPVCLAHPGTLPVINGEALKHVLRVGLAVGGTLADYTEFDRKNYFYPDLPKGYQISQWLYPLVSGGTLCGIPITRVHLEEDTASSIHDEAEGKTTVDYNRAGIPLMELVTEPAIKDVSSAGRFARELQLLLRYLGASEANMEKGQMRVEANVSVSATEKLGTKVEIKNLNSFRTMEKAVEYEIKRQTELLEKGEAVVQETRGWDERTQKTFAQRTKEGSADYRYFPDPDLPPLCLSEVQLYSTAALAEGLPELPAARRQRYVSMGIKEEDASQFVREAWLGDFFDKVIAPYKPGSREVLLSANYIANDLMNIIRLREASTRQARDTSKRDSGEQSDIPSSRMNETSIGISAVDFKSIIDMLLASKISSRSAKDMIAVFAAGEKEEPMHYAEHHGLFQTATEDDLSRLIEKVIAEHPAVVEDYRRGKEPALEYLVGQAMRVLRGAADAAALREKMKKTIRK